VIAWIFDVDGVLTDSKTKTITQIEIIEEIIKRLSKKEPVALNTGRSLTWAKEFIADPISSQLGNKVLLDLFFPVCEFGATWGIFKNGELSRFKDSSFSPPHFLIKGIKNLCKEYTEYMFFDNTKEEIITTEKVTPIDYAHYAKGRTEFDFKVKKLLEENNLSDDFKVLSARLGTSIINKHLNKGFGMARFLLLLKELGISIKDFVVFGDDIEDTQMGDVLKEEGFNFTYYHTGEKTILQGKNIGFPINYPEKMFHEGTAEILRKFNS
jgi:hydroxymethylpyrimidine pyrophosphatase-like HAD family hydrolase